MIVFFIKFNYKDLLTSVKCHVSGSATALSRLSHRTFFIGMALIKAIPLQMFQNKMKISPPVLWVCPAEHLQIYKKTYFICNDECTSDNNTYNNGGFQRSKMDLE